MYSGVRKRERWRVKWRELQKSGTCIKYRFRGEKYTPEQNQRFLNELAEVNLYTKDKLTVQNPFDTVKYLNEDKKFKIAFSDYFFNNIGEFVRNSTKVEVQR